MCAIGETLFIQGLDPSTSGTIHVFTVDGDPLRSFGIPYPTSNRFFQSIRSVELLACHKEPAMIAEAAYLFPEIRTYFADGRPAWINRVPGFRTLQWEELGQYGLKLKMPPEGHHVMVALQFTLSGAVLAQTGTLTESNPDDPIEIRSYMLRSSDGLGHPVINRLDTVLGWGNDRFASVTTTPHPRVSVFVRN
jgi:hypothetical protein